MREIKIFLFRVHDISKSLINNNIYPSLSSFPLPWRGWGGQVLREVRDQGVRKRRNEKNNHYGILFRLPLINLLQNIEI